MISHDKRFSKQNSKKTKKINTLNYKKLVSSGYPSKSRRILPADSPLSPLHLVLGYPSGDVQLDFKR